MTEKSLALTLKTDEKGMVITNNLEEQRAHAEVLISSGMLPKAYTKSSQVVVALQYAAELGLPRGVVSLRQIAVINGNPSIYGDLPMSIVYKSGLLESIEEYHFDGNCKRICLANKNINIPAFGHVTRVKRKGDIEFHESIFTMDDAKKANLGNVWHKFPKDMLKYRSRTRALKDRFPDILNGVSVAEYDYHVMPDVDSGKMTVDYNAPDESGLNERFEEMPNGITSTIEIPSDLVERFDPVKDAQQSIADTVDARERELDGEIIEQSTDMAKPAEDEFSALEKQMEDEAKERKGNDEADKLAADAKREKENREIEAEKESQREKSNVDTSKISPEIKKEMKKATEKTTKKVVSRMADFVIPSGIYEGKKIGEIDFEELTEYLKKLRAYISKNPNEATARAIYRAISTHIAYGVTFLMGLASRELER